MQRLRSRLLPLVLSSFIALTLAACSRDKPPPTPLPTKEKTIDRVNDELQRAQQQSIDRLKDAE